MMFKYLLLATYAAFHMQGRCAQALWQVISNGRSGPTRLLSFQLLAKPNCVDQYYSLSWFTVGHIYLIASPSNKDIGDGECSKSYVFHDTDLGKEILSLSNAPSELGKYEDDSLLLGDFKLMDIAHAFDEATIGTGDYKQENYDIVTSNCATFIMNMIGSLGLIVDERIMSYTARRLATANNGFIADLLRKSPNLSLLGVEDPDQAKDEYLLNLLVRRYVKVYYEGGEEVETSNLHQRKLTIVTFESDEIAQDHHTKCADQEYDVMIGIGKGHICLFAVPSSSANETLQCESVRFHLIDPGHKSIDKRTWDNFPEGSTHPINTYKFGDLVQTYEDFDVTENNEFDIVTNNVATIIVQMLCNLGVVIDDDILDFVTERFIVDQDLILDVISNSSNQELLTSFELNVNDRFADTSESIETIRKLVLYGNKTLPLSIQCPGDTSKASSKYFLTGLLGVTLPSLVAFIIAF